MVKIRRDFQLGRSQQPAKFVGIDGETAPVANGTGKDGKEQFQAAEVVIVACMRKRLNYLTSLLSKKNETMPDQHP